MKKIQTLILVIVVSLQLSPLVASSNTNNSEVFFVGRFVYNKATRQEATQIIYTDGSIKIVTDTETHTIVNTGKFKSTIFEHINASGIQTSRRSEIDTQNQLITQNLHSHAKQIIDRLTGEIIN